MLNEQQLQQYHDDGFLIVKSFFTPDELQPVIDEISALVERVANKLYAAGKLKNKHEHEGFYSRLSKIEQDCPGAAVLVHIAGILGPNLATLWSDPKLLDVIEQIIGPDIAGHPVWNIRSKTPINALTTVPWHQDTAYLAEGSQNTLQPTAWIPLLDVGSKEGTLQVLRGGHKIAGVLPHRLENTRGDSRSWYLYIDEADLPPGDIVTCEMKFGSMLLLNQLTPHRSTENYSDKVRWSIDLRWQRPDEASGFEAVKSCIVMRKGADRSYTADFTEWALQNRLADAMTHKPVDEFDTTVTGPWLERWAPKICP